MSIIFFFFLFGCKVSEDQIAGDYAGVKYVNTYDTISIYKGGVYERKVYNKNNVLALQMKGHWEYKENLLVMNSFFLNLDRDISAFPELLADTTMSMEVLVEHDLKGIRFCTGYRSNEGCYSKVEK